MSANDDESKTITIKIKVVGSKVAGSEALHELTVPLNTTILQLKEKVVEYTHFPLESIRLIFRGRSLQNNEILSTCKIEDGHTIIVHCSKSGQKSNTEDPPPPPRNLNPPPPNDASNSNQEEPNMFPQSPALPPLPHNAVTDFKRELSLVQHNIAILLDSATHLQMSLTKTNANEINESIQKYSADSRRLLQSTFNQLQSLRNTRFVTNNSRVEVDETNNNNTNISNNESNISNGSNLEGNAHTNTDQNSSNTNQNTQQQQQRQPRPVVDDVFTPNDKAFIQEQIANLDDYIDNNALDDSYSSTDIYRQLN